jgi:hypothetical protein
MCSRLRCWSCSASTPLAAQPHATVLFSTTGQSVATRRPSHAQPGANKLQFFATTAVEVCSFRDVMGGRRNSAERMDQLWDPPCPTAGKEEAGIHSQNRLRSCAITSAPGNPVPKDLPRARVAKFGQIRGSGDDLSGTIRAITRVRSRSSTVLPRNHFLRRRVFRSWRMFMPGMSLMRHIKWHIAKP